MVFAAGKKLQDYLEASSGFINYTLIPFFFALAILFLLVNITRYFVIDAADAYSREEAKKYMIYAIIALVFLSSIWGVINLVTSSLNIDNGITICPDYNLGCKDYSDTF